MPIFTSMGLKRPRVNKSIKFQMDWQTVVVNGQRFLRLYLMKNIFDFFIDFCFKSVWEFFFLSFTLQLIHGN